MKNKHSFLTGVTLLFSVLLMAQTPKYLEQKEAQAYKQHQAEITQFVKTIVGDQMAKLAIKQNITDATKLSAIKAIIQERETRLATYNYLLEDDDVARYQAKQKVSNQYKTLLIRHLFLAGEIVGSYNCRVIMRNKDTLGITPSQQESIVLLAIQMDSLLEKDPNVALRPYEWPGFTKILTAKQQDLFLEIKMADEVSGQVAASWKKLKENQLDYGMDSTLVRSELYRYHLTRDKAIYVNYNDGKLRDAAVKAITDAAPLAIKRIDAIPAAQQAKAAYNGSFSW